MSWISLIFWIVTMTIYFLSLRIMIIKSIDIYVDSVRTALLLIIIGIIPIVNIFFVISFFIQYIESDKDITGINVLKKILFIRDKEVDDRWR